MTAVANSLLSPDVDGFMYFSGTLSRTLRSSFLMLPWESLIVIVGAPAFGRSAPKKMFLVELTTPDNRPSKFAI
jgi:hypothetical protein